MEWFIVFSWEGKRGGGRGWEANVSGGRLTKCDTLDDMDIYSKKLILTLNTEHHII